MRGAGGSSIFTFTAGGWTTYPHSLTIKLPYVTKNLLYVTKNFYFTNLPCIKNFTSYTSIFNLPYIIKNSYAIKVTVLLKIYH